MKSSDRGGQKQLVEAIGSQRFDADWNNPRHRIRRLLSEFTGVFGLVFVLAGTSSVMNRFMGGTPPLYFVILTLSAVAAAWLLAAILALGDVSAHFDPAVTFAFALRGDITWPMTVLYWIVQLAGAAAGALLAKLLVGSEGGLAATRPQPGMQWQAVVTETVLTFILVMIVLSMANGPKLNGQFTPFAVAAWVFAAPAVMGAFEGASMNPARSFGPDLASWNFSGFWIYVLGPALGAIIAIGYVTIMRGGTSKEEAQFALGAPAGPEAATGN